MITTDGCDIVIHDFHFEVLAILHDNKIRHQFIFKPILPAPISVSAMSSHLELIRRSSNIIYKMYSSIWSSEA